MSFSRNIDNPTSIKMKIKQSKTDPFRESRSLTIVKSAVEAHVCAVEALREYLLQRNPENGQEPLFTLKTGEALTGTVQNFNLRSLLLCLGYKEKHYAPHNFRIGTATTAAAAKLTPWLIKTVGRWRSDCYEIYIRTPRSHRFSTSLTGFSLYSLNQLSVIICPVHTNQIILAHKKNSK